MRAILPVGVGLHRRDRRSLTSAGHGGGSNGAIERQRNAAMEFYQGRPMTIAVRFDAVSRHFGSVRAVDAVGLAMEGSEHLIPIPKCSEANKKGWCYKEKAKEVNRHCVFANPVPNFRLTVFISQQTNRFMTKHYYPNQDTYTDADPCEPKNKITNAHSAHLMKVPAFALNKPKNREYDKNANTPLHLTLSRFRPIVWNQLPRKNARPDSDEESEGRQNTLPPTQDFISQCLKGEHISQRRFCKIRRGLNAQIMLRFSLIPAIFEKLSTGTLFAHRNLLLFSPTMDMFDE
jgi:hypothetical protein